MMKRFQIEVSPIPFSPKSALPVIIDSGKKNVSSNGGICATKSLSVVTFKVALVTTLKASRATLFVCLVIICFELSSPKSSFNSTSISSSSGCESINFPNRIGSSLSETMLFSVLLVSEAERLVLTLISVKKH